MKGEIERITRYKEVIPSVEIERKTNEVLKVFFKYIYIYIYMTRQVIANPELS